MEANQKFEAFTRQLPRQRAHRFVRAAHARGGVRMCLDAIFGVSATSETLTCVGYDHSWVRAYAVRARDAAPLLPRGTDPPRITVLLTTRRPTGTWSTRVTGQATGIGPSKT